MLLQKEVKGLLFLIVLKSCFCSPMLTSKFGLNTTVLKNRLTNLHCLQYLKLVCGRKWHFVVAFLCLVFFNDHGQCLLYLQKHFSCDCFIIKLSHQFNTDYEEAAAAAGIVSFALEET